jgi:GNAT superfamily N-acetyltransferase
VIRQPQTDADFDLCVAIKNAVEPDEPVTVEQLRATRGGALYLHDGGGYVYVAPSSVTGGAYTMVRVAPEARGRGVGSALLEVARDHARGLHTTAMWGRVAIGDDASLGFVGHRGFEQVDREFELVRELGPDEGAVPEGIVELGERHRAGAYAVAVECTPDMPTAGPAEAPAYDDWVANELGGAVGFVAIDGDRVVGYATLQALPATPQRLEHGLTAVLRSHRGRGLAQRLKRAQIAWAARQGYRELVTYTSELNAPMRAVNIKLGYDERPVAVVVRGVVG